ncbi:DUF7674 family protein [Anditalea andensis]|uniref:DUF7674 domain-containing protein n=1 Tax=Anditalea andensis TaxID=1048983 RepID=A0A074L3W9_9BACT|nr:hypothetical protein [Anditalea andensis]KEO75899.1 hypothetical protein EL17_23075 [Anditalea andensis]
MDSKILKTLKEWLPDLIATDSTKSEYEHLKHLAEYCRYPFVKEDQAKAEQIFKIISLLYASGTLHDRNAIENEFLSVLAMDEAPSSLKMHLKAFPEKLKAAYLKTILEN